MSVITKGKIKFLRVNEVGDGFGPAGDHLDAEVIFGLDTESQKSFGFKLRNDQNGLTHEAMFHMLHQAFLGNHEIFMEYHDQPMLSNLIVFRVWLKAAGIALPPDPR
jgi:hypothetical protein